MLDFRIETFLCACRLGNYTKTAEELHITQPAVSQHIRWLEQKYGTKLFQYNGKQLKLTEAGEMLRSAALTARHDQKILESRMALQKETGRHLSFGATRTIGDFLMPKILKTFLARFPDTEVKMLVENTDMLLRFLDGGQIDFAVVEGIFPRKEYDAVCFARENYIAVCGSGSRRLTECRRMEELLGERILVREEGSGTRRILEMGLENGNLTLDDFAGRIEAGSLHVLKELAEAGFGVAFLYEAAAEEELREGRLLKIPLEDFVDSHDFTFLWRRGSLYAEEYREICRQWKQELVSE